MTSSSVPRLVSDVRSSNLPFISAVPVDPCLPVSSSSVPSSTLLSDFLLLCSSRICESFLLLQVLRSSSGLSLRHLDPFALRSSVARMLGIQFPDISKLRDGATLVKTPTYAMSQAFSRV